MTKIVWLVVLASSICVNAQRYDVVIDEVMCDPAPAVGLPGVEWIELRNVSSVAVSVLGWRIADASTLSGPFSSFVIQPDSTLIICSNSSAGLLGVFGRVLAVSSFPSLDNDGEVIVLKDHLSRTIHAVSYNKSWYHNSLKQEGGWSLEMIDARLPCTGRSNWKASNDALGGTPGRINSVNAIGNDEEGPQLLRGYAMDSVSVVLLFDEPLDSNTATFPGNFKIAPPITLRHAQVLPPLFDKVKLTLNDPIERSLIYDLEVAHAKDCKSNEMVKMVIRIGIADEAEPLDVVLNEVLFDSPPLTSDYLELFNRSNKIIDCSRLYLTKRSNGVLDPPGMISSEPFLLFPGDHTVITEDEDGLSLSYHVKYPKRVIVASLPSFPDTEGSVVLLNAQGDVVDDLEYTDDWHFALLSEKEGIALERISPESATNEKNNWTSASHTSGGGTPGYANSQSVQYSLSTATVTVHSKILSPDNDGRDDHLRISFENIGQNVVANILVFDMYGKVKRHLLNNRTISTGTFITWDGLGENNSRLTTGVYIILSELFDLTGKVQRYKTSVVIVGG